MNSDRDDLPKPKLLFIGAVREGHDPLGGEEFKNRLLLPMLQRHFKVVLIDTALWRKDPRIFLRIIKCSIFERLPARVLISASSASTYRLLWLWHLRHALLDRTVYLVVGGYFPGAITSGRFKASIYRRLSAILVQGKSLQVELAQSGLVKNVAVVPNFKPMVPYYGLPDRFQAIPPLRCVVMTRISRDKGVPTVFKALSLLPDAPITVDIFGPVDGAYREEFEGSLRQESRCQYQGFLDLMNAPEGSYRKLSSYHLLMFPTHWVGEGFPGVVLDAYLAGLPVIATDWNMNREVVIPGMTGWLIPPKDPQAMADALQAAWTEPELLETCSRNARSQASSFEAEKVFEEDLLPLLRWGKSFNDSKAQLKEG